MINEQLSDLVRQLNDGQLSRRHFIRRALGAGLSASALAGILAETTLASPRGATTPSRSRYQVDAKTLVIADDLPGQNWLYLDPARIYEINPAAAHNLIYETLYHLPDATDLTRFEPLLAEAMPEFSPDGREATIRLRPGVKFHNSGNEMTADDWIFSWNRLLNIKGNAAYIMAENIEKVEALDPLTLKVTALAPNAAMVAILTAIIFAVTDSKVIKEQGGSDAADADQTDKATDWLNQGNSAGTGPFILRQWDTATEVIVESNADYWGDAPLLDRVIWRSVKDPVTQLQLIQTGEADMAYAIDPDSAGTVTSDPNLQLLEGASLAHEYLALHNVDPPGGPLAVKEVRQAIANAIDYDGIINGLLSGAAVRPATIVPLGLLGADEAEAFAYQTDLAKAQELFDASGVGAVEITLTFGANQATPSGLLRDTLAAKLQSDLQQIDGLTVALNPMDSQQRLQQYREGKLQFTMSDWSPDYPDVHTYAEPFGRSVTGAAAKRVGYNNPQVDAWLDQGIQELDPEARKQIYVDIQKTLTEDAAFLVEFQPVYRSPARAVVQGVSPHGLYILQLRGASKSA